VVLLLVLAFIFVPFAANRITDWLWFREIGFERVFFLQVIAQWTLGAIIGLGALAVLYANARLALRGLDPRQVEIRGPASPLNNARHLLLGRLARLVVWPVSLAMPAFIAVAAAADWKTLV
jgi:uncharacterized membrane protein (UPF0182 family)